MKEGGVSWHYVVIAQQSGRYLPKGTGRWVMPGIFASPSSPVRSLAGRQAQCWGSITWLAGCKCSPWVVLMPLLRPSAFGEQVL